MKSVRACCFWLYVSGDVIVRGNLTQTVELADRSVSDPAPSCLHDWLNHPLVRLQAPRFRLLDGGSGVRIMSADLQTLRTVSQLEAKRFHLV
jgi:hypothetical protein